MLRQAVIVGIAVAVLYGLTAVPETLIYDDELLVGKQLAPRGVGDLTQAFSQPHYGDLPYYRPLVRSTYLLQKAIHGNAPRPYRITNAIIAGLIAIAAYVLLRTPGLGIEPLPALMAATWFALHPIASSCVYPVTGRETLVPTLLTLLAVAAYLRPGTRGRVVATVLFAAALFSKEQAVAVPLLFLAADLFLRDPRPTGGEWLRRYVPVGVVVLAYLVVRGAVLTGPGLESAVLDDPAGPVKSLAYGLQVVVVPHVDLIYEPPVDAWLTPWRLALGLVAALALGVASLRSGASVRGPALFWSVWFVAAQLPTANFFRQETPFDERYVFVGMLGPAALAATLISARWRSLAVRRVAVVACVAWTLALAAISYQRSTYFESALAFHAQWARSNPRSPNAHNGLGAALVRQGRHVEAVEQYERALQLDPAHAQAHNNLGVALDQQRDPARAVAHFERALRTRPRYSEAHYNLANALASMGRLEEAEAHYRTALSIEPDYPRGHNNYAALLVRQGRIDEALGEFHEVMRLDPGHARSRLNTGILLARQGRFVEAIPYYEEALSIDPSSPHAHYDLAVAHEQLGRPLDAEAHYRQALALAREQGESQLAATIEQRLGP